MGGLAVYGLGIVLTLDDQVSSKVGGINSSLKSLSQTAMSLTYVGKSLMNIGKNMLSPVVGLSKEIIRVGDDLERSRITFKALYGDIDLAENKLNEIIDYASTTPFEIESLKDCAMQFKTLGIEVIGAGSEITDSTGKTRQLIDVIGDAGAGLSGVARRGFQDVVYATREFITEGNKLSFLRRLGVDIDAVLEKGYEAKETLEWISTSVGDTAEERLKNYADLINALHMDGLMGDLQGSWTTVVSNMNDVWFKFLKEVGDAGAFNVFRDSLTSIFELGQELTSKDNPMAQQFFKNLGSAFQSLAKPLDKIIALAGSAAKSLVQIGSAHPTVLKLVLLIPALTGVLFVMSGAALAGKGAMMMFRYGLLQIVKTTPLILGKLLLLSAVFGAIGFAWKNDLGGIKTRLNGFLDTVRTSFGEANKIMTTDTQSMIESFKRLRDEYGRTGDWGTGLKVRIIEYKTLWAGLVEYWKLGGQVYDETWEKLNKMGLLSYFTKLAIWSNRIMSFGRGFASWFADVGNTIMNFARKIRDAFDKMFPSRSGKIFGIFDGFSADGDVFNAKAFEKLGKTVANMLPYVLGLIKLRKVLFSGTKGEKGGIFGMLGKLLGIGGKSKAGDYGLKGLVKHLLKLSPKEIIAGMGKLALIFGAVSLMAGVLGALVAISPTSFARGAVAIMALEILLAPLSMFNYKRFANSIESIARIKSKTFGYALLHLAELFGGMTILVGAIGALVSLKPAWFYRGALMFGLIELLLAPFATPFYAIFSKSIRSLANFKPMTFVKAIGNLAILIGGMALLVGVIGALTELAAVKNALISGITAFGLIGKALGEFVTIKSVAFVAGVCALGLVDIATFSMGVANFAIVIAGMVAIMEALGWLGEWDTKMIEHLEVAAEALGLIGRAIGEFVGSIVGGAVAGMTNALPKVGENIAKFFEHIKPYTDNNSMEQVTKFFSSLIGIKVANVKKKNLKGLAEALNTFVKEAKPFFKFMKNADTSTISKASRLMEALGYIGEKAVALKGSDFSSSSGLSDIAMSLNNSVVNFQEFLNKTKELDLSGLPNATKLFEAVNEWYGLKNLREGGKKQKWTGEIHLDKIAGGLVNSVESWNSWFSSCKNFDEQGIEKTTTFFANMAQWFSHSTLRAGGLAQLWSGSIDLSYIAFDFAKSAENFTSWFDTAKDFSNTGMTKTNRLFDLLVKLGTADIKAGFFKGTKDGTAGNGVIDVANGLKTSGKIFVDAFNTIKDIDSAGLSMLNSVILTLSNFQNIKDIMYELSSTLPVFSEGLGTFGTNAVSFFSNITSIGNTQIDAVMTSLSSFMTTISGFEVEKVTTLASGFESLGTGLGNVYTNSTNVKNNFGELTTQLSALNEKLSSMVTEIPSNCTLITDAINGMYSTAKETLETFAKSGQSYGSTLVTNIAKSITDNAYRIKLALTSAVNSAASSITVKLPVSPLLSIGHNAMGTMNWRGGLTELNERGGEIVDLPQGSRVYPHDSSIDLAFTDGVKEAIKALKVEKSEGNHDESVHFHEGSVVIYAQGSSDDDIKDMADKLMAEISRRMRRKDLANYVY